MYINIVIGNHMTACMQKMKLLYPLLNLALVVISAVKADESEYYQTMQDAFQSVEEQSDITDQTNLTSWDVQAIGIDFPCKVDAVPPSEAKNIHELTPYDIKVVAAMGDSITAAFGAGARNIFEALIEYRGQSWSIGGDNDLSSVTTLPNIIKKYNPNVRGFSIKTGKSDSSNSKLNVAVSGAKSDSMRRQAEQLVNKIKADESIDFKNDWKLVTLWIGGNDLCDYCKNKELYSPENYVKNIEDALDYLKDELPRTFVNLVQVIDITRLAPLRSFLCNIVHAFVCECVNNDDSSQASTDYQEECNKLVDNKYNDRDDFTVVIQPFFLGVELPRDGNNNPDKSYFAPDCFHFSTKGHKEGAVALWNNMLEPVGRKNTGWQLGGPIKCPSTDAPYFYTRINSNLGVFNSQIGNTDDEPHSKNNSKDYSFAAILTGTTVGVAVFILAVMIAVVVVAYKVRRRNSTPDSENLPLVDANF